MAGGWLLLAVIALDSANSAVTGCGSSLKGQGAFASPNHPNAYPSNSACTWKLSADEGKTLALQFTALDIELDMRCSYDSVKVYNGPISAGTLVGRFCGTTIPATIAGFDTLTVVFTSDVATESSGFSARFESIPAAGGSVTTAAAATTTTAAAGRVSSTAKETAATTAAAAGGGSCGNYVGSAGTVHSPNHPSKYPSSTQCAYTITVPKSKVVLTFSTVNIESSPNCSYDYLEVRDDDANGKLHVRLCGNAAPGGIVSSGSRLYLKFSSDSTLEQTGFRASWQELTCQARGGACVADIAACDGRSNAELPCDGSPAAALCCLPNLQKGGCGAVPSSFIVGGHEAVPHSWPWQASLQLAANGFHYCGATIVTSQWLVTAAHCVDSSPPISMQVVVGEHHLKQPNQEQVYRIHSYIMHEHYDQNGDGFPNDIALVKLTSPIIFNRYVQPACLPDLEEEFVPGDNCWITGWGDTKGTANGDVLNQLKADLLTRPHCRTMWGKSYIREGHVCLGNGLKGACNGDSGGPLVCLRNRTGIDRWILAGTTSWGQIGCQTEGKPSVYVRVSHYIDWISRKIQESANSQ